MKIEIDTGKLILAFFLCNIHMVLVALPLFDHVLVVLKFLAGQLDKAYVHS